MSRWRLALLFAGGAAYAGLSHWMMTYHASAPWALAVLFGPLWLTAFGLAVARMGAWGGVLAVLAGGAAVLMVSHGDAGNPNRLYVLQHVGINALLGIWFGATLRPGRLSLIAEFASRVHALQPGMRDYTAKVTAVWVLYFALTVTASLLLYALLPFRVWSLFANIVSPLLVVALFLGEHFMRYRLHPEFERTRLIDVVHAFQGHRKDSAISR